MNDAIGTLFVAALVGFGIWLLLREVMCWYWKVNRALSLLESIGSKLDLLPGDRAISVLESIDAKLGLLPGRATAEQLEEG